MIWLFASESDVTWGNDWGKLEGTLVRALPLKSTTSTGFAGAKRETTPAIVVSFNTPFAQDKVRVVVLLPPVGLHEQDPS